jgi:chemotaxis protein methyltransferase CheR
MIYFNQATQRQVVRRLLEHLAPDGLFFVGHSENLHAMSDAVTPVGHAIYRRRPPQER